MDSGQIIGPRAQLAIVTLTIVTVAAVRVVLTEDASAGVGFLFVVPVGLAAWWFGLWRGLVVSAVCLAIWIYLAAAPGFPYTHPLLPATVLRGLAMVATVLVLAELRARTRQLESSEIELEALRQALTPAQLPATPGVLVAVSFEAAEHSVSGDFYLISSKPDSARSTFVVGDVVGHGPEAARRATFARAVLASIILEETDPGEVLRLANVILCDHWQGRGDFLTAVCVSYDADSHRIWWAVGGHPAPITLGRQAEVRGEWSGPLLGFEATARFSTQRAALPTGEGLLIYTDGLIEARGPDGQRFGLERVRRIMSGQSDRTPSEMVAALHDELDRFTGDHLTDDVCIMALRANGIQSVGHEGEVSETGRLTTHN